MTDNSVEGRKHANRKAWAADGFIRSCLPLPAGFNHSSSTVQGRP